MDKRFKVDVEFVQTIFKTKLKQSDLVRLAHFAIEIANEQSNKKRTNSDEESQATRQTKQRGNKMNQVLIWLLKFCCRETSSLIGGNFLRMAF